MPVRFVANLSCCCLLSLLCSGMTVAAGEPKFSESERNHWAFQPVKRPVLPTTAATTGSQPLNPIDAFILAPLQKDGFSLSRPADKLTLLRRVTFDLVGLPPTPAEAAEFLEDQSPDAYARLVDRLLASPQYGEAWGRMWLDVVRFAETAGFNADPARPLAYKYRDYVIRAFNRGTAYDRFLQEQLAGDELFPDDVEALVATGYCRMWADESNASNIHLARQLALNDLTGNLGAAVLGLSIGCAQCHDHKFDPLLQTDFYELQAFFAGIVLEDKLPVGSQAQLADYHRQRQEWLDQTANLRHELHDIEREARIKMAGERRMKFPQDVLAAIDCLPEERTALQRQLAFWSERQMEYKLDDLPKHLSEEARAKRDELLKQLAEANKHQPKPPREASLMAVAELSVAPPKTHLLDSGSYDKPLQELEPRYPAILRRDSAAPAFHPPSTRSSGRRTELARWLTSADHPLTYRVWVNRIWQGHFGRGLVDNANDFGVLTPNPSHPELLDWLTSEFIASGYDTRQLHRQILMSATYQQAAALPSGGDGPVPPESGLAGFPRQRLSSERIRDAWLSAAGVLNDTMFGPGVRPELPPNFGGAANWKVSEQADRTRRSVYIYAKRNLPYPLLAAFDLPDMHETCGCRTRTTIAPQALMMLNSGLVLNAARQLAVRAERESDSADPDARVIQAWTIALGRRPSEREIVTARTFLRQQQQVIASSDPARTGEDAGQIKPSDASEAFVDLCHALLNANEFLFIE
ncbi:MAG: DUF1553 domain-containing protein [Planctomycetes bacterium]|nr:DUF1553 domain-containing protein [Planctomycetota bacterium]